MGVGLYLLTREEEEGIMQKYNPKEHTLEKLQMIIDEIFIESATLYCQKLRLIREEKKEGKFKGKETIDLMQEKQQKEMVESELETYKEYKVTEELVIEWMSKHQNDPYIKEKYDKLQRIHQTIFSSETGDGKIEHLQCSKMPTGMTEEKYVLVFRKQQQIYRYELFKVMSDIDQMSIPDNQKEAKLKEKYMETIKKKDEF